MENLFSVYFSQREVLSRNIPVGNIFYELHKLILENKPGGLAELELKIHELFIRVSEKDDVHFSFKNSAQLMKEYIDECFYKKISLDDLSDRFFLSKTQLVRNFRNKYHITPYAYLIKKRIAFSMVLLRNTTLSISEIAEKLQFNSSYHFSATFKKSVGVSPTDIRR